MIELSGVALRSRATGQVVLGGVDLVVAAGEVTVITGPSGSGKSALLRMACGALAPATGVAALFGRDLARLRRSSLDRVRRRVGILFDDPMLLDDDSALANVALVLEIAGVRRRERELGAAHALDRLGLAALAALPARQLTAGERRRLGLARALVGEPAILILDQPSADLDGDDRARLIALLGEHAAMGGAALVATSDPMLADAADLLAWTVLELDHGTLRRTGDGTAAAASGDAGGPVDSTPIEEGEPLPNLVRFPLSARLGGRE